MGDVFISAFVNYFWQGADESVTEYVKGSLTDFLNENDGSIDSSDIVADLVDFLPPEQDPSKLPEAVEQLRSEVNKSTATAGEAAEPEIEKYIWLQVPSTSSHQQSKEEEKPSPSLRFSDLKVSATEFKPCLFASSSSSSAADARLLAENFTNLDINDTTTSQYEAFYYEHEGEKEEAENAYSYHQQQCAEPPPFLDRDAILAVLQENFPAYSPTALEEMLASCGNSLPVTIDMLYRLENELYYGVQQQNAVDRSEKKDAPVEFNADDFPSLGGGNSSTSTSKAGAAAIPFGANYAGKAKAAAHLPAPPPERPAAATATGPYISSSSRGEAAPVWQAQGIEKFSTGVSVAEEYAAARAEARDHARARNVCFESATKAYIAGNKALAKELGAKGRWHNERMKLAHARAAEETFSRRNAATLAASTTSTSSSHGGPPTIDLHGLHVSEALHHIDQALETLQRNRIEKVRLVVGVGQHGKVPARLKTAVEKHLTESWGLRCREPYEGLLEVTLI